MRASRTRRRLVFALICGCLLFGIAVQKALLSSSRVSGAVIGTELVAGQQATAEPSEAGRKKPADNSRCFVCHLNFAMEHIATVHADHGIGCADCHGNCDAHIADESWASGGPGTPPGIMYPREKINPTCRSCHKHHNVPAKAVVKVWQKRGLKQVAPDKIVCTDCHGHHRVNPKLRRAWWDKRTGKPIKPEQTTGQ